jgi:prophage antirepressor-like protein
MLYNNNSITINTVNNELWVKAKDITSLLGFTNSKKTLSRYVDDDDICKQYKLDNTAKRNNSPLYINESGFYALVLNSEHKQAKKIKRWVTKIVLPAIRKTGMYNHMEEIKTLRAEIKRLKDTQKKPVKKKTVRKKKEPIPKAVRLKVWSKYIGYNKADGKCFCCRDKIIHQQDFQCGHIQSEHNGGKVTIQNLRPICGICNTSMGTKHMVEFMEQYGYDTSHFN